MTDRTVLLRKIQEISFVIDDLTLYLDTHPLDSDALDAFTEASAKRRELKDEYARQFEPLTMDCVRIDSSNESNSHCNYPGKRHFTWSDGPLPWDNQNLLQGGTR